MHTRDDGKDCGIVVEGKRNRACRQTSESDSNSRRSQTPLKMKDWEENKQDSILEIKRCNLP